MVNVTEAKKLIIENGRNNELDYPILWRMTAAITLHKLRL